MKTKINPYLNFAGNTEEAFNFYKSVFGGEFSGIYRFGDMPMEGHENLSEEDKNRIMHIGLPIGDENTLMATDALESMGQKLTEGNNFYLSITAESKEEADRLFYGLSDGGSVEVAMGDASWGSYFGMFKDPFGIGWMISYEYPTEE